ncbi:MAG: hypothetical protein H0U55_03035 [Rubrobacteraceae bacterium]|jgi:hypothetical protein|nr:hypothetical protein [Rubrobacteraceae bacterium]
MTDGSSRDEDRERRSREKDARRQEEKERRSDELQEAWRRRHPSEPEEREQGCPDKSAGPRSHKAGGVQREALDSEREVG